MLFHHIGVATNNIALTAQQYSIFGYELSSETIFDPIQNVYIAFMEKEGSPRVELVAPVNDNSPILNTINKMNKDAIKLLYANKNMILARIIDYDNSEIDLNQMVFDAFIKNNLFNSSLLGKYQSL